MARIGYIRVSTVDQNLDRQIALMESLGIEKIFQDESSGKNMDRPGLSAMLAYIRPGDEIHVESFSRLSRSTAELLQTVNDLMDRGIHLISHKENLDTTTASGRLMLTVFAAIAQFEREITLERQKEGIAAAKARGDYKGRARKPDTPELKMAIKGWESGEISAADAIRISGLSKSAFYERTKGYLRKK